MNVSISLIEFLHFDSSSLSLKRRRSSFIIWFLYYFPEFTFVSRRYAEHIDAIKQ